MNPYQKFETDGDLEQKGVKFDYGDFWFYVARPGGKNEEFIQELKERNERLDAGPAARSPMMDQLKEDTNRRIFLEKCLKGWGSKKHGEGKMVGRNDEAIEFSVAAADKLFKDLPELLSDVIVTSQKSAVWLKNVQGARLETDAKNSPTSSTGS